MSEYLDFPPAFFFQIALKHCPESALLYKELWIHFDGQLSNNMLKCHIRDLFGITPTVFRNRLMRLESESLLEFKEYKKSYTIDLVPFHDE